MIRRFRPRTALLFLALPAAVPADEAVRFPSPDPFAGDPYREDTDYRSAIEEAKGRLETDALRDSGRLALRDLAEKYPASPYLRYEQGCRLAADGKWAPAVMEWEEAAFADEGRSAVTIRALQGIAAAETRLGRKDRALKTLDRLAGAMPLSYTVQNRLAEACSAAGQEGRAKSAWRRSLDLRPGQPEVVRRLGASPSASREAKPPDLPALIRRMRPSVVLILDDESRCTGFLALSRGWVITAAHGVQSEADVKVVLFDDDDRTTTVGGKVVFRDPERDLALIRCPDLPAGRRVLPLAVADGMQTGERVYTLGNPGLGEETLTLTPAEGILAAARRELEGRYFIQVHLAVNPGNSGGPLVDASGTVIGVVTRKAGLEGVSFAVPSAEIGEMLADPGPLHPPPGVQ